MESAAGRGQKKGKVTGMPFEIIRDDITKVRADAIVNTANPCPEIGGGTDWAIHRAAGPELLAARRKLGEIAVGCSAATKAYALPAKYVLHTVSPAWIDGHSGEQELLRRAYDSALRLASELHCRSVAFPLMAAGTYGFPHDAALSAAVGAFTDFLLEHRMRIVLVLFNSEACEAAGAVFDDIRSFIDDNYVGERTEEEYRVDTASNIFGRESTPRERRARALPRRAEKAEALGDAAAPRTEAIDAAMSLPPCGAPEKPTAPRGSREELQSAFAHRERSFSEMLLDLLAERGGKDSEVYKRAEISRQLFSKIINNRDYNPTKSTAVQLAIGLQLDLAQTQKLLASAGYTLTRSSRTDLAVEYCINHGIYSVTFINEALYDSGLPLLKTGMKA